MIKKISEKSLYKDEWQEFFQDETLFLDGSKGTYAYVRRKSGVSVVVVSKNKKILLHKEYRYVIDEFSWEIQGGGIDEGETITEAAVRELKEESGIDISEDALESIGTFHPLNSLSTEKGYLFMVVADDEEIKKNEIEKSEDIGESQFFTFDEVYQMMESGEINDGMTANAVQIAMRKFNN